MFDSIDRLIADMKARDAAREAFVRENDGRSFQGTARSSTGYTSVIVSPSTTYRGGWRVTRFDRRGPSGHTETHTYAEAVKMASQDYGVQLSEVKFAGS